VERKADGEPSLLTLPPDLFNHLTYDLRQPAKRMGAVQRDRVSLRLQETTTFIDQCFQTEFKGLPVEQNDRAHIPSCFWASHRFPCFHQRLGCLLKRHGIQMDFGIRSVVQVSLPALPFRLGLRETVGEPLLHKAL
jgi:hypothetical protein